MTKWMIETSEAAALTVAPVPGTYGDTSVPRPGRPRSFQPSSLRPRLTRFLALAVLGAGLLTGCASVAPYEKEHLADPILALDAETAEEGREVKWLEAREGSTGGVGGAGGGCACN